MTVQLVSSMGNDLSIVNAARGSLEVVSTWDEIINCDYFDCGQKINEIFHGTYTNEYYHFHNNEWFKLRIYKSLKPADLGLLKVLMTNGHAVPFEHVYFTFQVHTSIKVAREWQRHRIGSYSEMSTRYKEVKRANYEPYMPWGDAIRKQVGKTMNYECDVITDEDIIHSVNANMKWAYDACINSYETLIALGVHKELASFVLPMGMNTSFYWTVNLRSLFNFMRLRNAPQALLEIREQAEIVETLVESIVPVAYKLWVENGRQSI